MRDNKNFFSFCILVSSRAWFLLVCFVVLFVFPVHAQDSGQLSLSPSRVSFSSQGTETQSAPKTVRVTNRGDGVLSFPRIFLREDPSGSFALRSGCSLPLESGESCELEVTFAPAESGVKTGTIEIQSSADRSDLSTRLLDQVEAQLLEIESLEAVSTADMRFANGELLAAYLSEARRDGVAQHAERKATIDAITVRLLSVRALLEVYETEIETEALRTDLALLKPVVIVWNDRRDSLFELYMLGGGLPASMPPYPNTLLSSVRAEREARR